MRSVRMSSAGVREVSGRLVALGPLSEATKSIEHRRASRAKRCRIRAPSGPPSDRQQVLTTPRNENTHYDDVIASSNRRR